MKHMRFLLVPVIALGSTWVNAQEQQGLLPDTLAEVGSEVITARDLIERLELMPWPGKERGGAMDSIKIKALRSLVAEQILALESGAEGIVPDSALRVYSKNIEKLFVRDELYKRQVRAKTTAPSEKDVREGMKRFALLVRILMIGASDEAQARAISRALREGADADSVIARPPGGSPVSTDTVEVTFGLLERKQEDAVYALSSSVPATEPILTGYREWVVLSLLGQETDHEYAKRSIPERMETVADRIRRRNELMRGQQYSSDLLSSRRAEAKPESFALFAKTIHGLIVGDSLRYKIPSGYRLGKGIDAAMDSLAPHLHDVLVDMKGGAMTIGDVLEGYRTYEGVFPTLEMRDFLRRLNASIRDIAGREYLAREGYRLHLDRAEDVQHDVGMWSNYWRALALMGKLTGDIQVTNEDVLRALEDRVDIIGHDYDVNVREILSDSLHESLSLLEKIVGGADMRELARRFSKREAWAARDGESGYFPIAEHPAIGFRALDVSEGTLVGPVKVPEGYSIFKVLGQRRAPGDTTFAFDSLKTMILAQLQDAEVQRRLNGFVASSASRYDVKLRYDRLAKTGIPPVNMVTKRMLGFGGSILAVPSLYPLWQWVEGAKGVEKYYP